MRENRDLVWQDTGWEGVGGTNCGEGSTIEIGAMVGCAAGSILGGGFTLGSGNTLGSGTTIGGGRGRWPCTGRMGRRRGRDGNVSGVGGDRVLDKIQLEKRSRS